MKIEGKTVMNDENKPAIVFEDGASYENWMGVWSRLVGKHFVKWIEIEQGRHWLDVGCGSGAFSAQIADMCAPSTIIGIDPSPQQIAFAKERGVSGDTTFLVADAMDLPFPENQFDISVMALVLFFVPDPSIGVEQMVRVTKPGGTIAAYTWDVFGGGLPLEPIHSIMREMGIEYMLPPSKEASQISVMHQIWKQFDLKQIETKRFKVSRSFKGFDEYWAINSLSPALASVLADFSSRELSSFKQKLQETLDIGPGGFVISEAAANAVKGIV